ncbi:MAG: Txe/YoeB family addiction module toxin [Synergistaceae bacterium]|nr:Txe/YoeB family addiction module toxin [Synergistaceae bacterium]
MLDVYWYDDAKEQYLEWRKTDRRKFDKVNELLEEIRGSKPYKGKGHPEPLANNLSGFWSRRIDRKNRIVYAIDKQGSKPAVFVLQCGTHYSQH